jgi:hypothetical protein
MHVMPYNFSFLKNDISFLCSSFYDLKRCLKICINFKSTIFWDITPCNLLKVNRRFRGTYRLYLQGRRISRARNQREIRLSRSSARTLQVNRIEEMGDIYLLTRCYKPP